MFKWFKIFEVYIQLLTMIVHKTNFIG